MHDVVEVAGGEACLRGKGPERHAGLGHEPDTHIAEGLLAELPPSRHQNVHLFQPHPLLLPSLPHEHVHRAVLERLLADGDANGAADEIRVGELLAGSEFAVVEQDLGTGCLQPLLERPPPAPPGLGRHHDVDVVGRHRPGGQTMPRSSWCCSTMAAISLPGPIP